MLLNVQFIDLLVSVVAKPTTPKKRVAGKDKDVE